MQPVLIIIEFECLVYQLQAAGAGAQWRARAPLHSISYPGSTNVMWYDIAHHVNVAFVLQSSHLRVVSIAQLTWIISQLRSLWWEGLKALVHEWLKC